MYYQPRITFSGQTNLLQRLNRIIMRNNFKKWSGSGPVQSTAVRPPVCKVLMFLIMASRKFENKFEFLNNHRSDTPVILLVNRKMNNNAINPLIEYLSHYGHLHLSRVNPERRKVQMKVYTSQEGVIASSFITSGWAYLSDNQSGNSKTKKSVSTIV